MEPKPIDARHLLDIDRQRRIVDMEGFAERLRALKDHKENPEDIDYDVAHDEESRPEREETAKQSAEDLKQESLSAEKDESAGKESPKDKPISAKDGKGARLDIEA